MTGSMALLGRAAAVGRTLLSLALCLVACSSGPAPSSDAGMTEASLLRDQARPSMDHAGLPDTLSAACAGLLQEISALLDGSCDPRAVAAMLMSIFTVSLANKSTSPAQVVQVIYSDQSGVRPSLAFAFLPFVLIALAETGRIPVDNPATHLELTMIHEAMILEYSGRLLALIEWAGMMKLFLFVMLGIASFAPWGIAGSGGVADIGRAFVFMVLKLGATVGIGLVLIETGLAKMRLFRLTEFLGAAFLMATLGMLSFYILE